MSSEYRWYALAESCVLPKTFCSKCIMTGVMISFFKLVLTH